MVEIPFQERWREAMLLGKKICTSRTKRYGKEGDHFEAFGALFELEVINKVELGQVTFTFFEAEGCSNSHEFVDVWCDLHPKGWNPFEQVYAHFFHRVVPVETILAAGRNGSLDVLRKKIMADLDMEDPGTIVTAFKMLYERIKELERSVSN